MANLLQMYPRGFLGEVTSAAAASRMGQGQYATVPNPSVEALWVQYVNRTVNTTSMEFRRKVLIVALKAFGVRDFEVWLSSQRQSPVAGAIHNEFLDDTLRFIDGQRREMSLENWTPLLESPDQGERLHDHSDFAKEFFGIAVPGSGQRQPRMRNLTDVIQSWCSQPGGIEDMLCTMHVLFGIKQLKTIAMGATQ